MGDGVRKKSTTNRSSTHSSDLANVLNVRPGDNPLQQYPLQFFQQLVQSLVPSVLRAQMPNPIAPDLSLLYVIRPGYVGYIGNFFGANFSARKIALR